MLEDQLTDDSTEESHATESITIPRRHLLKGTATVGALLVGAGSASANGKGGQGIVRKDQYFPNESFTILEVPDDECDSPTPDGSCRDNPLVFQCRGKGGPFPPGKGGGIPFPWWYFKYESGPLEGERLKLYTRDNSIKTGITYRWSRKSKNCPETPGYYQIGFVADR
jgi:hypothetical protein